MGRYISGDIDGKCWFGVQPSDFADRFGSKGDSSYLEYWFEDSQLPEIEEELKRIEKRLGKNLKKLDKFFNTHLGYTDSELEKALKLSGDKTQFMLREYADYKFGVRLRDYLKENAECSFKVEL